MPAHRLAACPATARRGRFDAAHPPLLTIASRESVTLECVTADRRRRGEALRISPEAFDFYVRTRSPRLPPQPHAHVLDGLRKAGWDG